MFKYSLSAGLISVCCTFLMISSCISTRTVTYFDQLRDSSFTVKNLPPDPLIQKNDILYISVSSVDIPNSLQFNFSNVPSTQGTTNNGVANAVGYLVDDGGNIIFPKLGRIKAAGLTKGELSEFLRKKLEDYLKDPVVTIRFVNFRVTVLGEVNRPGTYNVPNEKISMLEALGNAGDITLFGRKDNVLLIREIDSVRTVVHINLNDRNFMVSPYYYLRPNDNIYVQPNKVRVNNTSPFQQSGPIIISTLSLLVVLITSFTQ